MRATFVQITDHAIIRWKQRVDQENFSEQFICAILEKAKIIKKKEPLPYSTPRKKDTLYAVYGKILFILEPLNLHEYRLITVITQPKNHVPIQNHMRKKKTEKKARIKTKKPKEKRKNQDREFLDYL